MLRDGDHLGLRWKSDERAAAPSYASGPATLPAGPRCLSRQARRAATQAGFAVLVFFGVVSCGRQLRREELEDEVLRQCSLEEEGLVCLSVRSGWDLWLDAQGLRAGDEVLVSAITHPDMVRIIREHDLRAVPVDIDPETLAPRPWMLEAALTPRTRVVLVAHLFGGRMDLGGVAKFARE